jgi:hypothetical protein
MEKHYSSKREYFCIVEQYEDKVYKNPKHLKTSIPVDWNFDFFDKVDLQNCLFKTDKAAKRKLEKLRKLYLEQKRDKESYRRASYVETPENPSLHTPNQKEFEDMILDIFDRHFVLKVVSTTFSLD